MNDKAFTAVFLNPTPQEAHEIGSHPKWSAGSWSHALNDRDEYKRMFEDAVRSLAAIDEALGIDPDEAGGAAPILEAIAKLKIAASASAEPVAYLWKGKPLGGDQFQRVSIGHPRKGAIPGSVIPLYAAPRPIEAPDNSQPVVADTAKGELAYWAQFDKGIADTAGAKPDGQVEEIKALMLEWINVKAGAPASKKWLEIDERLKALAATASNITLTDEQIIALADRHAFDTDKRIVQFARALLASPAIDAAPEKSQAALPCPTCGGEVAKRFNSLKALSSQAVALSERITQLQNALETALEFIADATITEGQWHWVEEARAALNAPASKEPK